MEIANNGPPANQTCTVSIPRECLAALAPQCHLAFLYGASHVLLKYNDCNQISFALFCLFFVFLFVSDHFQKKTLKKKKFSHTKQKL